MILIDDGCSCVANGNVYTAVSSTGCTQFIQSSGSTSGTISCLNGLIFDVTSCVCNWPDATTCPAGCSSGDIEPESTTPDVNKLAASSVNVPTFDPTLTPSDEWSTVGEAVDSTVGQTAAPPAEGNGSTRTYSLAL